MNALLLKSMLKNFGIDPEEVQHKVEGAAKDAIDKIGSIDKRLELIEFNQKLLLACFDEATIKAAHDRVGQNGTQQSLLALESAKSAGSA